MAREYKYRLQQAPEARTDGSGMVDHDIVVIYSDDGATWQNYFASGAHKTVSIPSYEVQTVVDMPHANGTQKQAKNTAYKQLIKSYRNATPTPLAQPSLTSISLEDLQAFDLAWAQYEIDKAAKDDPAMVAASGIDDYITNTLGRDYVTNLVDFDL